MFLSAMTRGYSISKRFKHLSPPRYVKPLMTLISLHHAPVSATQCDFSDATVISAHSERPQLSMGPLVFHR